MKPFEAFLLYVALKNHFTQKTYDFHKYQGKTKVTDKHYQKRKDKYYFQKLAKHRDPQGYLIANFIENPTFWAGEISHNQESTKIYQSWTKRVQSLHYNFEQDMKKLFLTCSLEDLIKVPDDGHPTCIVKYLQKEISLESLILFVVACRCYSYWNKHLAKDVVWNSVGKVIVKYKPFLQIESQKCKTVVKLLVNAV
jgi:hypothetical protein